jgi:hypothetical protein
VPLKKLFALTSQSVELLVMLGSISKTDITRHGLTMMSTTREKSMPSVSPNSSDISPDHSVILISNEQKVD